MNKKLWASLYFTLLNPVAIEEQIFLCLNMQSNDKYPALQKLHSLSVLDVIVLTILIYFRDDLPSGFEPELSFNDIADHLTDADFTLHQINNALLNLYDQQLLCLSVDDSAKLHYIANKRKLVQRGIYIPCWDIYAMGLENLCKN